MRRKIFYFFFFYSQYFKSSIDQFTRPYRVAWDFPPCHRYTRYVCNPSKIERRNWNFTIQPTLLIFFFNFLRYYQAGRDEHWTHIHTTTIHAWKDDKKRRKVKEFQQCDSIDRRSVRWQIKNFTNKLSSLCRRIFGVWKMECWKIWWRDWNSI